MGVVGGRDDRVEGRVRITGGNVDVGGGFR